MKTMNKKGSKEDTCSPLANEEVRKIHGWMSNKDLQELKDEN